MEKNHKKKKRAFLRRSYLEDFKKKDDGSYSYEGEMRVCELRGADFRRWLISCWSRLAVAVAALVVCGCIPRTGMDGRVYIVMPFAFAVAFAVLCIWKFVTPSRSGGKLPAYRHERTVQRLAVYAAIPAILCAMALIGLLVDLARGQSTGVLPNVAITGVLLAVAGALLVLFVARLRSAAWR